MLLLQRAREARGAFCTAEISARVRAYLIKRCKQVVANINVIAIHGTCAKGAAWPRRGGVLHKTLEERLPRHAINWMDPPFSWTGANSHQAREVAANQLLSNIASLPTPSEENFNLLIGHSHGGNIALMSLAISSESRKKVSAVVCLSTPFLVATKRTSFFRELANFAFDPERIVPTLLMLIFLAFFSFSAGGVIAGGAFLAFLAVTGCWAMCVRHIEIPGAEKSVLDYYRFDVISTPVLSMRTRFDEALTWVRGWSHVAGVGLAVKLLLSASIAGMAIFPYVVIFGYPLWLTMGVRFGNSIGISLILAALAMAVLPFVFFGADMFRALVRVLPISFGEDPIVGLTVSFKSASRPGILPNFRDHSLRAGLRFNHSRLHSDPKSADPIASLIETLQGQLAIRSLVDETTKAAPSTKQEARQKTDS